MSETASPGITYTNNGKVHIVPEREVNFTRPSEKYICLCGAKTGGSTLDVDGGRLVDEYREENVCPTCIKHLKSENATIPMFMKGGEVIPDA